MNTDLIGLKERRNELRARLFRLWDLYHDAISDLSPLTAEIQVYSRELRKVQRKIEDEQKLPA